jgi:hypothetical protein
MAAAAGRAGAGLARDEETASADEELVQLVRKQAGASEEGGRAPQRISSVAVALALALALVALLGAGLLVGPWSGARRASADAELKSLGAEAAVDAASEGPRVEKLWPESLKVPASADTGELNAESELEYEKEQEQATQEQEHAEQKPDPSESTEQQPAEPSEQGQSEPLEQEQSAEAEVAPAPVRGTLPRAREQAYLLALEREVGVLSQLNVSLEQWYEEGRSKREALPAGDAAVATSAKPGCVRVERVEKIPLVVIVSHRRSGTHFTFDMIVNYLEGDVLIIKSNHVLLKDLSCECRRWLFHNAKLVHPHRNALDVVESMYDYRTGYGDHLGSFEKFIHGETHFADPNRTFTVDGWVETVHGWFASPYTLSLSFEDLPRMNATSLGPLARHVGLPLKVPLPDRKHWVLWSLPVAAHHKGRNISADDRLTEEMSEKLLARAKANPVWTVTKEMQRRADECGDDKPFEHDEICVKPDGSRELIMNEPNCMEKGAIFGDPTVPGKKQSHTCVPVSCPSDLKRGITFTRYGRRRRTGPSIPHARVGRKWHPTHPTHN